MCTCFAKRKIPTLGKSLGHWGIYFIMHSECSSHSLRITMESSDFVWQQVALASVSVFLAEKNLFFGLQAGNRSFLSYPLDSFLPAKVYIVPFRSIVGTLSMFSAWRCVLDICPWECIEKNWPQGDISQYTPWGAGRVLEYMISESVSLKSTSHHTEHRSQRLKAQTRTGACNIIDVIWHDWCK